MPNSYVINTGNGATRQYAVPFPFISRSHVTVTLDGVASSAFTWVNDGLIQMNVAPTNGVKVRVERNSSPNALLVDYENGSLLDEATLDLANRQTFYLAQEAEDRAQESIAPAADTNWDAGGKRIKNVGTPTDPADAVTKTYADAVLVEATAATTAAGAAQVALATAQRVLSETARTGAETARTGAETAQTASETARNAAQTAQTGAQTARTGAETARDAALAAAATLPVATAPDANKWLRINGAGTGWSYRTNAEVLADIGAAAVGRTLTAGSGLTGGGDLSANRTFTVDNTVVAFLAGVQAFTGAKRYTPVTLTDQATIAWDLDAAPLARVTLGGNRTVGAPTNQRDGGMFILIVNQDGTGGRTLAWNAAFDFGTEGTPSLPTGANKVSIFTFISNGTSMRCIGRWSN